MSREVVWLSVPLSALIASFLWINEFPDYEADRGAGKRTLVVRLGRSAASRIFALIVALAYVGVVALPLTAIPSTILLGLAPHRGSFPLRPGRCCRSCSWRRGARWDFLSRGAHAS